MTDAPTEREEEEGTWSKLRRRKVVQWEIAYAAGAWALLQVLEYLSGTFDWPRQIQQVSTIALLVGAPIVLVLAWYHGDRGQQRVTGSEFALLALLGILAGGVLWVYEQRSSLTSASLPATKVAATRVAADERPSIAVLPFENRSRLEDDAFFVDGIHDDILTQLTKIGAMKVIARTSVQQFRDTKLTTREIGERLGVTKVLEGGVQRAGNRVRITVQLIDAATDTHLWAENYDRELTAANIFAIQSEVAAAIAGALKASLTAGEQARVNAIPTQNLEAWEAYQLGKQRMARRTSAALEEAERFFQKAIGLDRGFALAYVGLADTLSLQVDYAGLPRASTLERAETTIAKALELEPDLAEAATTSAWLAFRREDFAGAESGFRRALALNPNYATAYHWSSRVFGVVGRYDEALRYAEKAVELDPLSVIINVNLGNALERVGRFGDALAPYRKAIEIDPSVPNPYFMIGGLQAFAFGRLDRAVPWFERAVQLDARNPDCPLALAELYVDLGDHERARLWLDRAMEHGAEHSATNVAVALQHLYDGEPARMPGGAKKALEIYPRASIALALLRNADLQLREYARIRARYAQAYPELLAAKPPKIDETNYSAAIDLAPVLQEMGELERAALLLDGSERFLRTIPRMGWMGYGIADVQIYSIRGRKERALAALRQAKNDGWRFLWRYYRDYEPNLEPIRRDPEFKAIFADIERDVSIQRAQLAARPNDAPLDLDSLR